MKTRAMNSAGGYASRKRRHQRQRKVVQPHAQGTTRVVQGPPGGRAYIYTQKHTDQVNESVNHIRYVRICGHRGYML